LVRSAMGLLGTGYAWGGGGYGVRSSRGTGKGTQNVIGVDCSGLTTYAYSTIGIRIPRTARQQGTIGYKTSIKNLRPGDLVVWNNGSHTSMYIGNGQIIESPNVGKTVRIRALRPGEAVTGIHLSLSGD
jgi:cell wall-associated NlpC family hydrolase